MSRAALLPLGAGLGFFVLWELVVRLFSIEPFVLPSPSAAVGAIVPVAPTVWGHAVQTLYTTLVGFALAVVFGVLLGALVGTSKTAYTALYPLLVGFNSVPKAALVPIFIIWFGIGTVPAILTAFLISFFPIVVNVATGIATVEPELRDVLRSLGAKPREVLTKAILPRSLPYFFASLKVAVTLAFVGSVISEQVGSQRGMGVVQVTASSQFNTPLVFGGLLVLSAMGILLYAFFAWLEHRFAGWAYRGQNT